LAYTAGINRLLDIFVLLYFVACGISRLARFNVTAAELSAGGPKVKYFEGTPIPTSVILVAFLAYSVASRPWGYPPLFGILTVGPISFHAASLLFALSGSLMISKRLHIPKW
jgi:CDP-diacylglycerol--serine O-phosphatidyltransferase